MNVRVMGLPFQIEGYDGPDEPILGFPLRLHQLPFEIGAFTATTWSCHT